MKTDKHRRRLLVLLLLTGKVVLVSTFVVRTCSQPSHASGNTGATAIQGTNVYQRTIGCLSETVQRGNNGDSSHAVASALWRPDGRTRRPVAQFASTQNSDDDDGTASKSKRDRIKDWMSGVSESKPMVRPIRLDGQMDEAPSNPQRIRANFDTLFAGMPTMDEILSGDTKQVDDDEDENDDTDDETLPKSKRAVDDSWFDEERQQILANYDDILKVMLNELQAERERDPTSVPDNAEALTKSVLKQEMDTEINETRQTRLLEMLDAYQRGARWDADTSDVSFQQLTPSVQKLMEESEAEYAQLDADRRDAEDFQRYEQAVRLEAKKRDSDDQRPAPGENLDQWALDRLKDMMGAREDSDGDEMILDNLQDNVAGLENSILKNEERPTFTQTRTMKEWQMYRSIASRLEKDDDDDLDVELSRTSEIFRDELIMSRLDSWKDYIAREEQSRIKSGLTRGPKLPFAWQETTEESSMSAGPVVVDKQSRIEARKVVNRMSIEAMESLLEKSDATRRDKLQKEIDYLKSTLELTDYLDIDESSFDIATDSGPVDTKNLFKTYASSNDESASDTSQRVWDSTPINSERGATSSSSNQPPTSGESPPVSERPIPPPNTPLFADMNENSDDGETFSGDSRLGNMEEQKLEAMFRRAGARTAMERAAIRSQWEAFQAFEKERREKSGLGGESDDLSSLSSDNMKYNVSAVMKEDGDFDAEAILASIGPRPVRKSSATTKDSPTVDKKEVMDSLYRTVSAVGGGRYKDDPLAKEQQRASFQEFMEKESEMRELLDEADTTEYIDSIDDLPSPTDDQFYAEEVLSALGPRPKPRRAIVMDAGDFSDQGGALTEDEDDEDDEEDEDDDDEPFASDERDEIPEWLRKENAEAGKRSGVRKSFLGSDIDEVFDDTDYELNARQLAEYEKRRSGKSRQMGIDISEVLGRSSVKSNDYADFKYDDEYLRRPRGGMNTQGFASRKNNLLDYIELDVRELNALMDHKDSVYSTGVSQYLPRINKPFKDFGAIFRLEGALIDVNGFQFKAWTKVAEENGLKKPMFEDVQLASVARPELAVKDVFFWTDNFVECKRLAASHRKAFKEVFDAWAKQNGITIPEIVSTESLRNDGMVIGEDDIKRIVSAPTAPKLSESEKVEAVRKAWTATAIEFGKSPPGDEMYFVAASLSPDIAVTKAFGWSSDPLEVDRMVRSFRRNLGVDSGESMKRENAQTGAVASVKPLSQNDVMELHYQAWSSVADSFGFSTPETDEVLAAFVINEPEIAARGFGWSDDSSVLRDIVEAFKAKLDVLMKDGRSGEKERGSKSTETPKTVEKGVNNDALFKVALDAWSAVAKSGQFPEPDYEQVQFAMSVGPEEAIVNGFEWAVNPYEVTKLVKLYRDELARRRSSWNGGSASSQPSAPSSTLPMAAKPSGPSQDDVYRAVFEAWTAVAFVSGYLAVDDEQVQFAMSVGPEEAIINGFGWTDNPTTIAEIVSKYKTEIAKRRSKWQQSSPTVPKSSKSDDMPMFQIKPEVNKWVKSLLDVEMQCSLVSYLERDQVDVLLQLSGLDPLFPPDKRVTASNGYITDKDEILGAALRAERRPDHCVVFDSSPQSSVAAHDVEMQSVSLIGPYPRYELLSADTTTASLEALTAVNIRRLFSERVYDQPMADIQQIDPDKRRTTRTRFFEDA